uniref:Bystin n=1 Tax=Panagrolaimus superbus TaxID=310955 RepID=A0A914YVJ3_9BILA
MDSTSENAASRRSTRKRKSARKHSYSPQPPPYRKKVSDPPIDEASLMQKKEKTEDGLIRSQETNEVQQKKYKKTIKKEPETAGIESENEGDSGNYDTSSVSELEDSDELPPQLYSIISLQKGTQSGERDEYVDKSNEEIKPSTLKSQVNRHVQNSSVDTFVKVRDEASITKNKLTEKAKLCINLSIDPLAALKDLNPELFNSALKEPLREDDTLIVVIKLLENASTPSTSDTVVSFLQDAENLSRKFIKDLPLSLKKPRISLEKAWEAIAVTYGLFGPTVVPIILHFIKQQNILETKYFNRPAALFLYTLTIVKYFHEHLMPLLSPQISVTHSWILDTLEQPFLRSYLTMY